MLDGMQYDISPSYHFFQTWITRDMLIIAERNNWNFSIEAKKVANKAFKICHLMRQPDGLSPVINDGYALDMDSFNSTIPQIKNKEKVILPHSNLAILNNKKTFLLLDCSHLLRKLSHYHGGKLGITLFINGKQFLIDGATCNYDAPEFSLHYKRAKAHSSLQIDGKDDSVLQGRYTWIANPTISFSNWNNNTISGTATSNAPGWEKIIWQRTITLEEKECTINDLVETNRNVNMTFQLILHKDVKIERIGKDLLLTNGDTTLKMSSTLPFEISTSLGFVDFQQTSLLKLVFSTTSAGGNF